MKQSKPTPQHLVLSLQAHAKDHLKPLLHEFDPEMGWSELSSLSSIDKGLIHRFVEKRPYLSILFGGKVSVKPRICLDCQAGHLIHFPVTAYRKPQVRAVHLLGARSFACRTNHHQRFLLPVGPCSNLHFEFLQQPAG